MTASGSADFLTDYCHSSCLEMNLTRLRFHVLPAKRGSLHMRGTMNTLERALITVIDQTGASGPMTIPGVLAALTQDLITGFPALRAHQRHAWHSFLVLLA